MAVVSTGPASTTCAETIAGSAASRTKAIISKYARAYFMQAVRRSRRGHPAPARRRKKGRPDMRAAHGRRSEEVPGHDQLHVARRLPDGGFTEVRHLVAGRALVTGMHVDLGLLVKQVVDREACLQVDLVRGQRPHHARTQVGDPGHASERALLRVDQLTGRPVVAAGLAQPARTAAAELAGSTGTAVVIGPAHAERGDRAAGARGQRAARSEEHTSELQSLMRISYAVLCLK